MMMRMMRMMMMMMMMPCDLDRYKSSKSSAGL